MLFYYRDNLFRRYGLSTTLRDVAEKAQLARIHCSSFCETNRFSRLLLRNRIPRQTNTYNPRGAG